MSNRAYLTLSPFERIYPSAGGFTFSAKDHTALASAGCVPLLWLAAFSESDLHTHTFAPDKNRPKPLTVEAPLCRTEDALARLEDRSAWLAALYADRGDLEHHLGLLLTHLRSYEGAWMSIELEEIAALHQVPTAFYAELRACLGLLEQRAPETRERLAALATVMLDTRIISLDDAPNATREEQWNFFRVLGEGWARETPWD